jgi:hypothetical protein
MLVKPMEEHQQLHLRDGQPSEYTSQRIFMLPSYQLRQFYLNRIVMNAEFCL